VSVSGCVGVWVQLVVDHVKHAFTCKLNNIAPNVFKDYLAELCRRATHFNVHRTHRVVRAVRPCSPARARLAAASRVARA
jgi:hypothetical protein